MADAKGVFAFYADTPISVVADYLGVPVSILQDWLRDVLSVDYSADEVIGPMYANTIVYFWNSNEIGE